VILNIFLLLHAEYPSMKTELQTSNWLYISLTNKCTIY